MLVQEPAGSAAGGGGAPNLSEKIQLHETLQEKHYRLQQLMQVNRKLRTTFDAKKSKTDELKMQNNELERKLQAREAEESGRARQLQELQMALQGDATVRKKEAEELQKQASALQEKIEALNEENLALGEKHKDAKSKVADQENSMKMLNRRSQELVRLIELMAGHLNEAQQKAHPGQPLPALRAGAGQQGRAGLVDFTRLPGYDLQKLIGEDAHLNSSGKGGGQRKPSGTMSQRSSRPSSRHSRSGRGSPSPELQHKRGSSSDAGRPGSRQSNASRTSSRSGWEGSKQHKEKERQGTENG